MDSWIQFFLRAGIPDGLANRYAKSFQANRISREMLSDLDKPTLSELGITAIGDQIAILRLVKDSGSAVRLASTARKRSPMEKQIRVRITAPGEVTSSASEARRGKPPPDRNEIYHVVMPAGNTKRTQQILRKAEVLRQKGLAVRGTTGVRQGGRSVSPIDKNSEAARVRREAVVSSSSDRVIRRLGVRGLHSDSIAGGSVHRVASGITKKRIQIRTGPGLLSRAISASLEEEEDDRPRMRVAVNKKKGVLSRATFKKNPQGRVVIKSGGVPRTRDMSKTTIYVGNEDEEDEDEEEYEEEQMEEEGDETMEESVDEEEEVEYVEEVRPVHERISFGNAPRQVIRRQPQNDSVFGRLSFR